MAQVIVKEDGTGDYTSLAAAITASETDILIQGTWANAETSTYTISSATTIECNGDAKHSGYIGSSPTHWRNRATASGRIFTLQADTTLTGVDLQNDSTATSAEVIRLDATGVDLVCEDSLLSFDTNNSQQDLIYISSKNSCTVKLTNCMGWGAGRSGIGGYQAYSALYEVNSCSFYDIGSFNEGRSGVVGISGTTSPGTVRIFNSLLHVSGFTGDFGKVLSWDGSGTLTADVDRCITNQSTIDNVVETDCILSATWTDDNTKSSDGDWVIVEDITTAPYDFRLQDNTYNEAQDAHSDGSGAGLTMPSTDMLGETRSAPYCVGAYRYVSSVSPIEQTVEGVANFAGQVTRKVNYKRTVQGVF